MTIEQFLFNTIVKTGREARELIAQGRVLIYTATAEIEAEPGMEVNSTDKVMVLKRKNQPWVEVPHPSSNGTTPNSGGTQ